MTHLKRPAKRIADMAGWIESHPPTLFGLILIVIGFLLYTAGYLAFSHSIAKNILWSKNISTTTKIVALQTALKTLEADIGLKLAEVAAVVLVEIGLVVLIVEISIGRWREKQEEIKKEIELHEGRPFRVEKAELYFLILSKHEGTGKELLMATIEKLHISFIRDPKNLKEIIYQDIAGSINYYIDYGGKQYPRIRAILEQNGKATEIINENNIRQKCEIETASLLSCKLLNHRAKEDIVKLYILRIYLIPTDLAGRGDEAGGDGDCLKFSRLITHPLNKIEVKIDRNLADRYKADIFLTGFDGTTLNSELDIKDKRDEPLISNITKSVLEKICPELSQNIDNIKLETKEYKPKSKDRPRFFIHDKIQVQFCKK